LGPEQSAPFPFINKTPLSFGEGPGERSKLPSPLERGRGRGLYSPLLWRGAGGEAFRGY